LDSESKGELFSCTNLCWLAGVFLGIMTFLVLNGRFGVNGIVSLVLAVVVCAALGWFLARYFCSGSMAVTSGGHARHQHDIDASPADVAAVDRVGQSELAATPPTPKVAKHVSSASLASSDATAKAAPASKPAAKAKPATKAKPAAKTKPATKAKPAAKPKATAAAKPARASVAADGKPETLKKARAGGADDLKRISGVGPKLEQTLNELGFYHFDQVAAWRKKEVEWVDTRLKFKGRIERDEWIKQAKKLARETK